MDDPGGHWFYHYDRRGLLAKDNFSWNDGTEYCYDKNGNVTTLLYPRSGRQVSYTYDDADRVSHVAAVVNGVSIDVISDIEYEPFGPRRSVVFGNGVSVSRIFDSNYRIKSHRVASLSATYFDWTYTYNEDTLLTLGSEPTLGIRFFGYDEAHRITTALGPWGGSGLLTYDVGGNRLSKDLGAPTA